ncbi:MAG: glutamate 5-kinase [Deltaproteobacteria bacterium]|nr:glutamate 5-kinase [Deltaproteobacteria bacterium]OIP63035.1 MAG: glutamate 5-kinase [Nitrospirae bacterium CG2_30_70_394]PIU77847.1 MAG: glutamate 5-kinase [Nitrospirae bacterium CG06_land_8_20_14_3_00_70_43]PIX82243.1 MAG: glutamate 5-kinase [Nitrospirae bacterium CG_4_10_14_3_um_filter_70_108]PJB97350.1 MAG: glutamate 5-kinase [Nitrospirae bacterium CG_4_9_14_0_8_um_filter_70_14]HBB40454.1 glutamate 5-kinase [Pseudomonadota bacterium]
MNRQELLDRARRVVVKVGSRVVTADGGGLDGDRIQALAGEIAELRAAGREPLLVSSGAVAAGWGRLGLRGRPHSLAESQAAAAVGQGALIAAYDGAFRRRDITCAQILVTHDDARNRDRFLNARRTLEALLRHQVVPVINENDTVSTAEIRVGDNDHLSAQIAHLVDADLLVILSDIDALCTGDPYRDPDATPIHEVTQIDEPLLELAGASHGTVGSGGMRTKVLAARQASRYGVTTLILNGHREGELSRALAGEITGTLFWPESHRLSSRKQWIAFSLKPAGELHLDLGACRALTERGSSLLPAGITKVRGTFPAGSLVSCIDPTGKEIARGLTNYTADELLRILGHHSHDIATLLGYTAFDEVIHRDDLVVL